MGVKLIFSYKDTMFFGTVPAEFRHKRDNLFKWYNTEPQDLLSIKDWQNIDLRGLIVKCGFQFSFGITDPEIVPLCDHEQRKLARYYLKLGMHSSVFYKYIVRDNVDGKIYLPKDCQIQAPK